MSASAEELVVRASSSQGVVVLRLNRPNKRNALSNQLIAELANAVRQAEDTRGCRALVITGGDRFFSAGADVGEMRDRGIEAIHNRSRALNWRVLETTSVPMVASVSGICFGGGHELAMLCDIVVASPDARFGQPEIKLGHIPGDGATQRLPRRIGKYAAMQMILTGEPIDADTALRWRLINEISDDCEARAREIAQLIARHSSRALALAKDAVRASDELPLSSGLERERGNIAMAFTTHDQKEGLAAFFEKRPAKFTDE